MARGIMGKIRQFGLFAVMAVALAAPRMVWADANAQRGLEVRDIEACPALLRSFSRHNQGLVEAWSDSLSSVFYSGQMTIPTAQNISLVQGIQFKAAAWLLKRAIFQIQRKSMANPSIASNLDQLLTTHLQYFSDSPTLKALLGPAHRTLIVRASNLFPRLNSRMRVMLSLANQTYEDFFADFSLLKSKYGDRLFTDTAFRIALMNVYAMRLFGKIETPDSPQNLQAINAAALLHPIFDGAEDSGQISKQTISKIAVALDGKTVVPDGTFESVILSFIQTIYQQFPPAQHPLLRWLFLNLLQAQIASEKQKTSSDVSAPEIFKLTAMKGGLSTSLFAYIALGGLTDEQFEFYFRAGTLFQLLDDLNDVLMDHRDGIKTLFSSLNDPEAYVANLIRLLGLMQDLSVRTKGGALFDFLSISFFSQALAGISLMPDDIKDEVSRTAGRFCPMMSPTKIRGYVLKLTACMRFSLSQIRNPFFSEIDQFLWQGNSVDVAPLPKHYEQVLKSFVGRIQ